MSTNGVHTPSYGGAVNTGVEWDYIVHPDGTRRCVALYLCPLGEPIRNPALRCRECDNRPFYPNHEHLFSRLIVLACIHADISPSRAPSRSPARAGTNEQHRAVSNPLDAIGSLDKMQSQSIPAASSAHAFSAHPSSHPHEPTISEEASAYVGRSVTQSQSAHAIPRVPPPSAGRNYPSSQSTAAAASLAPQNTSTGTSYAAAPSGSSSKRRQYRQVGDWILQKTLGQGSMGKVKLGINVHTQEKVSLRVGYSNSSAP